MRESLTYKILAAVLTAGSLGLYAAAPAAADDYTVTKDGEIISSGTYTNVYGNGHSFTINGGKVITSVYGIGDKAYTSDANGGNVTISDSTVTGFVYGGYSSGSTNDNIVTISGSTLTSTVYGGYSSKGSAAGNEVYISDSTVRGTVYGGRSSGSANSNIVTISGSTAESSDDTDSVYGGYSSKGSADANIVNVSGGTPINSVYGGYSYDVSAYENEVYISGGTVVKKVYGGYAYTNANGNSVTISGGTVKSSVYGGYLFRGDAANDTAANDNSVNISGNADITNASLYGSNKTGATGNTLTINGWSGSTQSVQNFNTINFSNINWVNGGTVLNITNNGEDGALANTNINLESLNFAGGTQLNTGDSMTFVKGTDLEIDPDKVTVAPEFTAGVATVGTGAVEVADGSNSVKYTLTDVKQNSQVNLVAENRAVAAAFVNQGTDLISDSLDVLSRNDSYGVKTFAAVHGNKSKYDVNSDIKINGWSTIVGVGNAAEFADGDNFSWGVFYENGSGNYRTYNSFNNEFFRGDGSLVYNGGGIAARYENNNGVYTEGSLRAGMLKSDMDNALRDASGNNYGYESESAYYGAHIGVGKIIGISESSDLDVYGKFFHTYVEGDSFNVAGDKFEFDSINSDKLKVGARVTTNKENKFSTYYGLAYEYEFNGNADMKAQGINAPTQSLQGSSYMAELGLNYQPTPDSPWSFDLNLRGYTGERQGGSFNVQATYTF